MTLANLWLPVLGSGGNRGPWSFESGSSVANSTGATTVTGVMKPNPGDLCVVSWGAYGGSVPTNPSIADGGSGGWTILNPFSTITAGDFGNDYAAKSWWKLATSADYNGGSGVTITCTTTAVTGNNMECDVFRLAQGTPTGLDLVATVATPTQVTTTNLSPASGSTQASNIDELAWTSIFALGYGGFTGTNTFTGTSVAANLLPGLNTSTIGIQFVQGVQASATAGTNVFENTWTNSRRPIMFAATFYFTP